MIAESAAWDWSGWIDRPYCVPFTKLSADDDTSLSYGVQAQEMPWAATSQQPIGTRLPTVACPQVGLQL